MLSPSCGKCPPYRLIEDTMMGSKAATCNKSKRAVIHGVVGLAGVGSSGQQRKLHLHSHALIKMLPVQSAF